MKHVLRSFLSFLLFAGLLSATSETVARPVNKIKIKPLTDTIPFLYPDTTNIYLTFPLVVRQDSVPIESNELIQDRLSCLKSEIPLHFNQYVRAHIDYFTIRNRKYSRRVLERQNVYFPLFEKYLAQYKLPDEFKYLAVVESALLPRAVSSAKAVGLWQFMAPTANDFRLKQNEYLDERMDPEKSTIAACRFLKDLYRIFGDWELVMAAYNCGAGNVKKAIARAGGGKKTFWEIFPYLPKETRGYVPTFTAITYMMNHAPEHEIFPDTLLFATRTDTILINQSLDLAKLSVQLEMQPDELARLNPEIRKAVLPATIKNYPLKIPAQKREILAYNRTSILDSCRLPVIIPRAPATMLAATNAGKATLTAAPDSASTDSLNRVEYVVIKGDFLHRIAQKHQVTVAQVKAWNQLENPNLVSGQKLIIYLAANQAETTEDNAAATPVVSANNKAAAPVAYASTARQEARKKEIEQKVKLIHTVKQGDTLWNISNRYNNIPVENIKKLNKLKSNEIKPGQKLVIS